MIKKLADYAQTVYPQAVAWRHELHRHPEISCREYATAERIEGVLRGAGLAPERVDGTGVVCDIEGEGEGPLLLLRGDTDALPILEDSGLPFASENPGVMHACGHDLHTAALLGAAVVLADKRELFRGTVRLCFQHAEENGHGAKQFHAAGLMDGADACFAMHVYPSCELGSIALRPGAVMASVDYFAVTIQGKSAHVASPHEGTDALAIAAEMITAIQPIVSRHSDPFEPLVLGVGKLEAGTAYNIVAGQAKFEGTLRCLRAETSERVFRSLRRIVYGLAEAYGAEVKFELKHNTDPLINDEHTSRRMMEAICGRYGRDRLISDYNASMAGEDFALFTRHVPGCLAFIGVREEDFPATLHPLHSGFLGINDDALLTMMELHLIFVSEHASP